MHKVLIKKEKKGYSAVFVKSKALLNITLFDNKSSRSMKLRPIYNIVTRKVMGQTMMYRTMAIQIKRHCSDYTHYLTHDYFFYISIHYEPHHTSGLEAYGTCRFHR